MARGGAPLMANWIRDGWLLALLACITLASGCVLPERSDHDRDASVQGGTGGAEMASTGATPESATDPEAIAETAAAIDRLDQMAGWLAAQTVFRFRADVSYDAVQPSGERIEFGGAREVVVERPDRLRVDVVDRDGSREILAYDGQAIWLASPPLRAFARAAQTGPIDGVIDRLVELDAPLPLADLIDPGLAERLRPLITSAARVGIVRLDGRLCEQLAYRSQDVDFQLFIESGDTPIPRRLVVDYRDEPGRPQFRASLRDWDLAPKSRTAAFFRITPPIGAQRLELGELVDLMNDDGAEPGSEGGSR